VTSILVAYASAAGATQSVAEAIGHELASAGATVEVRPARTIKDVTTYDTVVVGSGIHAGAWYRDALGFVSRNRRALSEKRVAYFVTCATLQFDTERHREVAAGYVEKVVQRFPQVRPVSRGLFGGAIRYATINPIIRTVFKATKVGEGDWRDWDAIRTWAANLRAQLA
jgi:menaquinone-dependent protoporphyrinogen oxidase